MKPPYDTLIWMGSWYSEFEANWGGKTWEEFVFEIIMASISTLFLILSSTGGRNV